MACVIFVIRRKSSLFRFFYYHLWCFDYFGFFSSLFLVFFDVRNILCIRKIWMINGVCVWHFSALYRGETIRNSLPLPRILVHRLVFFNKEVRNTWKDAPVLAVVEQPARKRARDVKKEYRSMLSRVVFRANPTDRKTSVSSTCLGVGTRITFIVFRSCVFFYSAIVYRQVFRSEKSLFNAAFI